MEGAALPRLAFQRDRAAMQLHQLACDTQAQADPFGLIAAALAFARGSVYLKADLARARSAT